MPKITQSDTSSSKTATHSQGWNCWGGDYLISWLYQAKKDGGATLKILLTATKITSWAPRVDEKYLH